MADVLIKSVICFFAVYGITYAVLNLFSYIQDKFFLKKQDVFIIVTVKDQQTVVEAMLRSIVWNSLNDAQGGKVPNILVVDMGSSDNTIAIVEKLKQQYRFIHLLTSEQCPSCISNMINK